MDRDRRRTRHINRRLGPSSTSEVSERVYAPVGKMGNVLEFS